VEISRGWSENAIPGTVVPKPASPGRAIDAGFVCRPCRGWFVLGHGSRGEGGSRNPWLMSAVPLAQKPWLIPAAPLAQKTDWKQMLDVS